MHTQPKVHGPKYMLAKLDTTNIYIRNKVNPPKGF